VDRTFVGFGTLLNVVTVVVGSLVGIAVGHRFPARVRDVVTDVLGLVTILVAALSAASVTDEALGAATGSGAPVLIVLGSLLVGGVAGSLLRIEERLEGLAGSVQAFVHRRRSGGGEPSATGGTSGTARRPRESRELFVEGWLTASLLFCVGPLTILGSLSDGMGRGSEQLVLKSVLDGFAALAFASTFGIGVLMSALSVLVIQGALTLVGVFLETLLPGAHVAALTATGGLLLAGIGLRLLRIRQVPVGDMLPALVAAPLLTQLVVALR
jgi:uncharacterized membrane protein YqgA involved in biofilm formation